MRKMFAVWILLLLPIPVLAQSHGTANSPEIRKLDFLVGEWQGEGWIEFVPGQRRTSKVKEVAQSKAGGQVLMIEGLGKAKLPAKEQEVVVHDAFALAWYDSDAKRFRMQAFRAGGGAVDSVTAVDADIAVSDRNLVWGFRDSRAGQIRFSIKLDEAGRWFEIGELSQDGKSWRKFFEMTLQKVK